MRNRGRALVRLGLAHPLAGLRSRSAVQTWLFTPHVRGLGERLLNSPAATDDELRSAFA
jgi:hypothetical protein